MLPNPGLSQSDQGTTVWDTYPVANQSAYPPCHRTLIYSATKQQTNMEIAYLFHMLNGNSAQG